MTGGTYKGAVVIAEDDEAERLLFQDALEDAGYLVLGARDGTEALTRLAGLAMKTVAIVDLHMPRMDGGSLVVAMKADPRLRDIPIIAVTGKAPAADVPGADRVLYKPISAEQLLREIAALME